MNNKGRKLKFAMILAGIIGLLAILAFGLSNEKAQATAFKTTSEDFYVTFPCGNTTKMGESTIVAENEEAYILQMGNETYVVPKECIIFE